MTHPNELAAVAMSRMKAAASVPRATCNRCGSRQVAWVTSAKTGKNYLADGLSAPDPTKIIPSKHRPHFKTCKGQS